MNYPLLKRAYNDGFDDGYFGHYKREFATDDVAREYAKGYDDGTVCRSDADNRERKRGKTK